MVSLSKKINKLVARKQHRADADIENEDVVGARSDNSNSDASSDDESDDDTLKKAHYVDVGDSELRKGQDTPLVQRDPKYTGAIGSRKDLFNTASTTIPQNDIESDEVESSDEIEFEIESDQSDEIVSDQSDEVASDQSQEDQEDQQDKLAQIINRETQTAINKLSQLTQRDAQKGHSILKQTKLFENIVDLRIKLQKLMNLINQLPLTSNSYSDNSNLQNIIDENNKLLVTMFQKLTSLRQKFQIDDHISTGKRKHTKKRSYSELLEISSGLDSDLSKYRSTVLNKWSNKIQMASGSQQLNNNKFKSINQPTNVQVENQLANMDRLIKRTRLNRTNIKPFNFDQDLSNGKLTLISSKDNLQPTQNDDIDNIDIPQNYDPRKKDNSSTNSLDLMENPYIFNDEDFYRLLLNDLLDKKLNDASNNKNGEVTINSKSNNNNNNNNNNKLKKNIDTKASKGRKLNFSIQDPIAHFETPINNGYRWSDEQIDEFFAGLLGQKIDFNEGEEDNEDDDEEIEEEQIAIKNDDIQIFG